LAEFGSVVNALRSAWDIQQEIQARNKELPENRKMNFRIGVNLGDVIEEGERLYGDGVNIAARLEGLAEEGGICISGTAYDHVKNKLPFRYDYLGEQEVKNIKEPVRVYRLAMEFEATVRKTGIKKYGSKRWQMAVMGAGILLLVVIAVILFRDVFRPEPAREKEFASIEKLVTDLPEKASIAILPFTNLSGDPEQEYFSDGITNDIITGLSKFRELLVIASNTVFTYKGKPVKVQRLSQELDVRYVLEGSVQKLGAKVRINAQLIDATTGHHLWAERYDRDLRDLFNLQDEIVQTIIRTMAVEIDEAERTRAMGKDTGNLKAYDYLLRGKGLFFQRTRSANREARRMFEEAVKIDPRYASAYAGLGATYVVLMALGWTEFPNQALGKAHDLARKALSLDESNAWAHALLGNVFIYQTQYDLAVSELQRAIELNPNDANSYRLFGMVMLWSGKLDDAVQALQITLRFDPNTTPGSFMLLGLAYYLKGQYEAAIGVLERGLIRRPDFPGIRIGLAASYAKAGRLEEAKREADAVLRLNPFFEVDSYGTVFRNPADRNKILEGLRKAGLK
jgi:adenylate cyclase